jgi:hypothetical protein
MSDATRRSFLRVSPAAPKRLATPAGPTVDAPQSAQSRRSFLQATAAGAAGVAVVTTGPKLAGAVLHGASNTTPLAQVVKPSSPPPSETVMAYVRDAERGEVTVLSGTHETTYRDPALVQRLIDAGR